MSRSDTQESKALEWVRHDRDRLARRVHELEEKALVLTDEEWTDLGTICMSYAWSVRSCVGEADQQIATRLWNLCHRLAGADHL